MLSQHLIKSETAHAQTNLKQSEGLAGADCSGHYSGLSDSLPSSPHLSELYKVQPYEQAHSPPDPFSHPSLVTGPKTPFWQFRHSVDTFVSNHYGWGWTSTQLSKVTFTLKLSTHTSQTHHKPSSFQISHSQIIYLTPDNIAYCQGGQRVLGVLKRISCFPIKKICNFTLFGQ